MWPRLALSAPARGTPRAGTSALPGVDLAAPARLFQHAVRSRETPRRWARTGKISAAKLGKRGGLHFRKKDLNRYVEGRRRQSVHDVDGGGPRFRTWSRRSGGGTMPNVFVHAMDAG